jgi:cytochrome c6
MIKAEKFRILLSILFIFFKTKEIAHAYNVESGKVIFNNRCIACHKGGTNVVIPEKNLQRLTLEANGMYSREAIMYQVLNGKNGMPAFGGRLKEMEIEDVAEYVMSGAERNFEF